MTLAQAVQNYSALLAAFKKDESDYGQIINIRLPQEEKNLSSFENQVANAKTSLHQAETAADVKTRRDALRTKEESVEDQIQLIHNLKSKVKIWEITRSQRRREVEAAAREMWGLKKAELLAQLVISPDLKTLFEKIIAAEDGLKEGWGYRKYSSVIDEILSEMTNDEIKQRRSELSTELGL